MEDVVRQERKEGTFRRGELLGRFMAKNYSDGQTRDMTKNIGEDWKEIGNGGKGNNQEEKE